MKKYHWLVLLLIVSMMPLGALAQSESQQIGQLQEAHPIVGTWQLLSITQGTTTQDYSQAMLNQGNRLFYVNFLANNQFSYNMDVNTCTTEYKIVDDQSISFPKPYEAICTTACCDNVSFGYTNATQYRLLNGDFLELEATDGTIFYFLKGYQEKPVVK